MRRLSLLLLTCLIAACGQTQPTEPDGAPPPPPPECTDGDACDFDGTAGVCGDTQCGSCSDDASCQSAYGDTYACVEGACVVPPPPEPECTEDADCDTGQICSAAQHCIAAPSCTVSSTGPSNTCGTGGADLCCQRAAGPKCLDVACCVDADCGTGESCEGGECIAAASTCVAPTAGSSGVITYHVDPTYTGDKTGSTACPFTSLHKAFSKIRNDDWDGDSTVSIVDGATIDSTSEGGDDEFPLSVPAFTRVHTANGAVADAKITAPSGKSAFEVKYGGTTTTRDYDVELDHLELKQSTQGTSGSGVKITAGNSTKMVQVDHVEIHNFDYGIKVEEGGYAAINWGVDSHDNADYGMYVTGGHAVVTVGSDADEKTHFDSNKYGIYVNDDSGSALEVYGALNASDDRTVTASDNSETGIHLSSASSANTLEYIAVKNNGLNGLGLYGGAAVKVRHLNIVDNAGSGIVVKDNGTKTSVEDIDLGKSDNSDWGYNIISGSGDAHICVKSSYDESNLHAKGNTFNTVDCSVADPSASVNLWIDSCDGKGGGVYDPATASANRTWIGNCDWTYNF